MKLRAIVLLSLLLLMVGCSRNPKPTPTPTPPKTGSTVNIVAEAQPRTTAGPRAAAGDLARPNDSVAWDYPKTELTNAGVLRFEVCYDTIQPCVIVTPDQVRLPTSASPDVDSYASKFIPMLVGPHTVTVKACNATECSDPGSASFILSVRPGPPVNVRIGGFQLQMIDLW